MTNIKSFIWTSLFLMIYALMASCIPDEKDKSSSKHSDDSIALTECQEFIKKNAPHIGGAGLMESTVFDSYKKNGNLVVEVGYKQGDGDTYRTRLCIIDSDKGTISSPSIFNESEWRK